MIRRSGSICIFLVIAAASSALSGCQGDTQQAAASSHGRSLIVLPDQATIDTLSEVTGVLAVNPKGCFTVDGELLVLEPGAHVAEDGKGIVLPNGKQIALGEAVTGSGGHATPRNQAEFELSKWHLVEAARHCWSPGINGAVMVHFDSNS